MITADYDGTFVVFDGLNGSGKSTAVDFLAEEYPNFSYTYEPSNSQLGQLARNLMSEDERRAITITSILVADRSQHTRRVILPALKEGQTVICDRYYDSTYAFQVPELKAEGVEDPEKMIDLMHEGQYIEPDYTIFFDIDPEECADRLSGSERYEEISFQYDAYPIYKKRMDERANTTRLDASQQKMSVRQDLFDFLSEQSII